MKWIRVLPIVLVAFLLAACGDSQSDLLGKWTYTESSGGGARQ